MDPTGVQPALMVVTYSGRRKSRFTTRITTSPDLKDLAALTSEYADFVRINKGNLVALQMVDEYVLRQTISCDTRP